MSWTADQIVAATAGQLTHEGTAAMGAVSTDTRALGAGSVFLALVGENFDGHDFITTALENGATGLVVATGRTPDVPTTVTVIEVADTLTALGDLAKAWLQRQPATVVAITGSNGKTGTKNMVAAVLSAYGSVVATHKNHNNLIGLPQTAFRVTPSTAYAVFELGMNAPGEIARLTDIANPDVGLVVSIGEAHLEGVGSIPGVVRAKGELYDGLRSDAVAVINGIDKYVVKSARGTGAKRLMVGANTSCEVSVSRVTRQGIGGFSAAVRVADKTYRLALRAIGQHEVWNAALAIGVVVALGLDPEPAFAALQRFEGTAGRLNWTANAGVNIIDDTYNANPASMRAALRTLAELGGDGRRIAVLGDMLELGRKAGQLHKDVGVVAADMDVDILYAVGQHNEDYATGFYGDKVVCGDDADEIVEHLRGVVKAGDWVLVKGSRGMRMERVVAALSGGGVS